MIFLVGLKYLQVEYVHAAQVTIAGAIPEPDSAAERRDDLRPQPERLLDGHIGQTDVGGPLRLDEALKYAVGRIETDPRKIEIIISYLGWDDRTLRRLKELDQSDGLNAERVVPTVACAVDRLRQTGFVPEAVERSLVLAETLVPVLDTELNQALLDAKLCYQRFACDGLVSAAEVFRERSPFEAVVVGTHRALVKSGTAEGIAQLAVLAQRTVQSYGCANLESLAEDSEEIFGSCASAALAEAAARTSGKFEWLDREHGWFWYIPEYDDNSNCLVDEIKRVLAVTPRILLSDLQSAIRRDHQSEELAPPLNVLSAVCKRLLFVRVEGDVVVRVAGALKWEAVLGLAESIFVKVLQTHGPVLHQDEFLDRCLQNGISQDAFVQSAPCSPVLVRSASNMYALVGASASRLSVATN